ncbi:hypothetical protein HPB48_013384 [Haemaphysalis longicornis]|uniref:Nucleolar protein 10-like N-terminal domain-containing protein n=1 Tax=Haemaphysalis longicornis TaxID=44386 RepID=A0A9J6GY00_HAELO|nr:hypothetical protein HPB48_013384 [Haemaphysalis longicornis]
MQVSNTNDVKIYNLSAGRSLPEWLSDRKKRMLAKKHSEIRHRIELIQDFEMPTVSTNVAMSRDGQFVMAVGTYKPRVRCFEVSQLSMKFERCFDSDVVTFDILSDDYTKMVFLHCDRYVEFHASYGRYHRIRIPKFGRDMAYVSGRFRTVLRLRRARSLPAQLGPGSLSKPAYDRSVGDQRLSSKQPPQPRLFGHPGGSNRGVRPQVEVAGWSP